MSNHITWPARTTVLLAGLLAVAGCADPRSTARPDPTATVPTSASRAADTAFVQRMIAYHRHTMDVLALADSRARDPQVRDLAAKTLAVQKLQITTMTTLLVGWSQPTTAPAADDDHPALLATLAGSDFDRQLLTSMIAHDEAAIAIGRAALTGDTSTQVRDIATAVVQGMSSEVTSLHTLLAQLAATPKAAAQASTSAPAGRSS